MSYILVATNFSAISENAVNYAAGFAASANMPLVVIHSFNFPIMVTDIPVPASLIDDTQKGAEKQMGELTERLGESYLGLTVTGAVKYGGVVDCINEYAATEGKPWLVVMGNSNTDESSAWFFSTLREARENLYFSILAIPPGVTYQPVKRLCFAIDIEQPENTIALNKVLDIVLQLGCQFHVFNARGDGAYIGFKDVSESIRALLMPASPHYHYKHTADVNEDIVAYCRAEDMDWLAIMPGHYSFFESLFHQSHTKALAKTVDIPMLILHDGWQD